MKFTSFSSLLVVFDGCCNFLYFIFLFCDINKKRQKILGEKNQRKNQTAVHPVKLHANLLCVNGQMLLGFILSCYWPCTFIKANF